jgi:hypothetical protein
MLDNHIQKGGTCSLETYPMHNSKHHRNILKSTNQKAIGIAEGKAVRGKLLREMLTSESNALSNSVGLTPAHF